MAGETGEMQPMGYVGRKLLPEDTRFGLSQGGSMFAPEPNEESRERMRRENNLRRWLALAGVSGVLLAVSWAVLAAGWG